MIVEGSRDNFFIIMADSDTSEVLIKLKRNSAIELRDRLNELLYK